MNKGLKKKVIIVSVISFALLIGVVCYYFFFGNNKESVDHMTKTIEKKKVINEDKRKEYKASLIMVGDALIHEGLYQSAGTADGSYDFKPMIENLKPIVENYDLAYYNQETILGGVGLGLSSYPRFNSPTEVGDAFIDAGFNIVSLATNHTMDKGEQGVLNSLEYWNSKEDIVKAGSYSSFEDRDKERIYEKNGIKYAFFSYTTWTNGLETPVGKEYLNNVYSNEKAQSDIARVRDKVDVIMVAMHWGTEYSLGVSPEQTEIANYLSSIGVDIIIGAHPHVVEPIEFVGKTLVIYSLGNVISCQEGVERLTGLLAAVDINKIEEDGNTTISIDNVRADLLYTSLRGKNTKVYPYSSLNNTILPNYMEYYERYKGVVSERYQDISFGSLGG